MNLNNCNYIKYARVYVLDDARTRAKLYRLMQKVYPIKCRFLLVLDWVKLSKYLCFNEIVNKLISFKIKGLQVFLIKQPTITKQYRFSEK
jgi:hypothetical protein